MGKKIALLVGPSGSGKTTIANYLSKNFGLAQIQSYTTRAPRYDGEAGHEFVSNAEFDALQDLVAYTEFDGHRYAATSEQVENNDLYVVDVAGVEYFKERYCGTKIPVVFLFRAPGEELKRRMLERGDRPEAVAKRVENDAHMFADVEKRLKKLYEVRVIENMSIEEAAKVVLTTLR